MFKKFNQFHMVTMSPWPIICSIHIYSTMLQATFNNITKTSKASNYLYTMVMMMISMVWWKNTIQESNKEGLHQKKTTNSIKMSMILFIMSEILFFSSFFWAYFHVGISPSMEMGLAWPPNGIKPFNPINVPLLNTIILVSSGFSITWSHHYMMKKNYNKSKMALMMTILLGVYFSLLQMMEYIQSEFSLSDSSYGTIFFMSTGFHGIHVMIGTTFLLVNFMMMKKMVPSSKHHTGFEMAAWYWHFVDVVWLFLYLSIYWWSN